MYGTYSYSVTPPPARGDIGTATYDGVTTITPHKGVRTTYSSSNSTPIGPDPKPFFFKNGAGLNRAAVASLVWSGTVATCTWLVYEADADNTTPNTWGNPVAGPVVLTDGTRTVRNPYRIQTRAVSSGIVDIYGIDYDSRLVFCVRSSGTNGDTYTVQPIFFEFPEPTGNDSFGVDLEITSNGIYALFINGTNISSGPPSANFLNSTVVKLNTSLGSPVYKGPYSTILTPGSGEEWPAPNAFSIQAYGSDLVLVAVGGPQYYTDPITWNPESRVQKINQSTLTVINLLHAAIDGSDPTEDQLDFRALSLSANGNNAYLLAGSYDDTYTMHWRLYHTTMTALLSAGDVLISDLVSPPPPTAPTATLVAAASNLPGYLWGLLFSESTVKTWFVQGENLAIYNTGGSVATVGGIGNLTTFTGVSDFPGLNFVTIYEGEVAPTPRTLKGYVAPAFASNSAQAMIEREKFLKEIAAAKAKE
jgi:hypothetical protein